MSTQPEALSKWMLNRERAVHDDFAAQVLSVLERQEAENARLLAALEWAAEQAKNYSSVFSGQIEKKIKEARG